MELPNLQCKGCGSTNITFDSRTRKLICNQCGREEFYSRAALNSSGKVLYSRQNALKYFSEGSFDVALKYAHEVLNISLDYAAAMYIQAYVEDFVQGKTTALELFFDTEKTAALEYEEVRDLIRLFLYSRNYLMDYEEEVLDTIMPNMQAPEDKKELCTFVDSFSGNLIGKRPSMVFLTRSLIGKYAQLAAHCGIPKTCFALIEAIQKNPDSPYVGNRFFLKAKTRYFYDEFVKPIGTVIEAMEEGAYKQKFLNAYQMRKKQYETDAGLGVR